MNRRFSAALIRGGAAEVRDAAAAAGRSWGAPEAAEHEAGGLAAVAGGFAGEEAAGTSASCDPGRDFLLRLLGRACGGSDNGETTGDRDPALRWVLSGGPSMLPMNASPKAARRSSSDGAGLLTAPLDLLAFLGRLSLATGASSS
mmetsp:Transcript_20771/g.39571  ORF Transcript_20771/g.39571 Transcript_20771/m.39571 type:complete len:145 (-) Transcript_20771:42-476(-)